MNRYPNVSEGLKLVFYGEILAIIGAFLSLIPFVGVLVVLVGGLISLYGLYKAGSDHLNYRTAFMLTIIETVVNVVGSFATDGGVMDSLLSIITSILSLAIIYLVCMTTADLLNSQGSEALAARGKTVWTINLVCTVVSVVLTVLMFIPLLNLLAIAGVFIVLIVQLVGYILYLTFLNGSYKVL